MILAGVGALGWMISRSSERSRIPTCKFTKLGGRRGRRDHLAGRIDWTLGEPLSYGTTYTVAGTATGTDGKPVPITGTYTTVTPVDEVTTSFGSGDVIGDPNRVTRPASTWSSTNQRTTTMSNPAYGYTNVVEHWAAWIAR